MQPAGIVTATTGVNVSGTVTATCISLVMDSELTGVSGFATALSSE